MLALPKSSRFHFIGIGGIGMSALADVLLDEGYAVSGSDLNPSPITEKLFQKGARIFEGHEASQVDGSDVIVYSSAINPRNPEWQRAHELRLRFMKRGELLAELLNARDGIAIAGSHGKTTTTSLTATLFIHAKLDPTFLIGGVVKDLGGNAGSGKGNFLIAEADESDSSFLYQKPLMTAITNIDNDHLDHFGSKDEIIRSFEQYVSQIRSGGCLILNQDDVDTASLSAPAEVKRITYGHLQKASYQAIHIDYSASGTSFTLLHHGIVVGTMRTHLLGEHNVSNALAAIALAHEAGINFVDINEGLLKFTGVGRRLEKVYEFQQFLVLDDYGHHPTEIRATLSAIKKVDARPLIVIFEPHRFTRTKNFWNEFQDAFSKADEVYFSPIYPASEQPIDGISSENLVKEMQKKGMKAHLLGHLSEMQIPLRKHKNEDCILLTLGAGAISKAIREMVKDL
jgi:UDP-N-acetylmuramate--alanine ligase